MLFVDNVEKVNYKNFHVKEGVELITSEQSKVIEYFDNVCKDVIDIYENGSGSRRRHLSAAVSTSTINSKDEEFYNMKFDQKADLEQNRRSIEVRLQNDGKMIKKGALRE